MVDWDRVDQLRSAGKGWSEIADDPKVGFHPDKSAGEPGRALRALYRLEKSRSARQGPPPVVKKRPARDQQERWTLIRFGYLAVAVVGVWCLLAYAAPSPVGLLVPWFPWLALALAALAFLLGYSLLRSREKRWTAVFRGTVIGGVVLGLVFAGMIGLVGALVFGCPYLPPAAAVPSTANATGWHGGAGSLPKWDSNGKPVVYFYGATWCPYCSASSWAIWKALTMYAVVTGATPSYSSSTDVYHQTPEMILANLHLSANSTPSFQVSEYTGGVDGTAPGTSTCYQLAYVNAYSGGSIPFLVIGGIYVHGGTTIVDPASLTSYEYPNDANGDLDMKESVHNMTGTPWNVVKNQTYWIMAMIAKCGGLTDATLPNWQHDGVKAAVEADLAQL